MVLLGDEAQVEARSVHLEIVLIRTQDSAQFAPSQPWAWKSFLTHLMEPLGDMGHLESRLLFGDSISVSAR
jgi:hypothetical protein